MLSLNFKDKIWLSELYTSSVPDLVRDNTCVMLFLVVYTKKLLWIHFDIDLKNSAKIILEFQ